jgi:hypothetical protein
MYVFSAPILARLRLARNPGLQGVLERLRKPVSGEFTVTRKRVS